MRGSKTEGEIWHDLISLSLWCYPGVFRGEGFLNIPVFVNGCSCLILFPNFTAVTTLPLLNYHVCACPFCIFIFSHTPNQKGGGYAVCIKCFTYFELCICTFWQICSSMSIYVCMNTGDVVSVYDSHRCKLCVCFVYMHVWYVFDIPALVRDRDSSSDVGT